MKHLIVSLCFCFCLPALRADTQEQQGPALELEEKKNSIIEGFKACWKVCEGFIIELVHKEMCHVLKHLPQWLERLGKCKVRSFPNVSECSHFFPLIDLLQSHKKSALLAFPTPLFNELNACRTKKEEEKYLFFIMSSPKNSVDFLKEMMQILESLLTKKNNNIMIKQVSSDAALLTANF